MYGMQAIHIPTQDSLPRTLISVIYIYTLYVVIINLHLQIPRGRELKINTTNFKNFTHAYCSFICGPSCFLRKQILNIKISEDSSRFQPEKLYIRYLSCDIRSAEGADRSTISFNVFQILVRFNLGALIYWDGKSTSFWNF